MIDPIVRGIATILWGSAWADHAEEHACYNLSGCKIEDHMPEIPTEAWILAGVVVGMIEQENGKSLACLLADACTADDMSFPPGEEYQERFGNCLAYTAMGAGVGWEDNHEPFPIEIPDVENYELRTHADEACEDDGRPRNPECGHYYNPKRRGVGDKCPECGAEIREEEP